MKDSDVGYLNHIGDTRIPNLDGVYADVTSWKDISDRTRRQSSEVDIEKPCSENDDGNRETSGR
jgi:hypothetical protein